MKKRGFPALGRPLALLSCALFTVWAVSQFRDLIGTAFARGLSGEAAVVMLRVETERHNSLSFTHETVLTLGSPLMSAVKNNDRSGTGDALTTQTDSSGMPQDKTPQPPVMTPALTAPSPSGEEPPPADASPGNTDGIWDDRVWPVPDENNPDAHPVRELTLLPVGADGEYVTDGSVFVNNDTQFSIDIPALLEQTPKQTKSASEGPQILIIHTHGSESFLPDERDFYIPTDIERTEDTKYNVVRLGDEMTERLEALGLTVIHDREIHDYPTYNGSYGRALTCIENYAEQYPTIQVVLDIHRDAISTKDGTVYKAVTDTGYGKTAQMMFVVGSNGTGLPHDGWRDNLSFAARLQERLLSACSTLMRPIHLRKERFNQHATPASLILEVGTAGNSLTEALRAVNVFCDVTGPYLAELLLP